MTTSAKKIKVLIGVNDFLVGGVQRQLVRQLALYDRQKFDISVVTLFQFTGSAEMYHLVPKDISVYKFNFRGFTDIKNWLALVRLLRSLRPDIVMSSLFFSNTVLRVLKPFIGYAAISREHNTYFDKTFFARLTDKVLSFFTDRIVCVSRTVAEFTAKQEHISQDKFKVIHNGIDLDEIAALKKKCFEAARSFEVPRAGKMVLNVARLTKQKNHENLIRAFGQFALQHQDYYLVILGEGAQLDKLNKLVEELGYAESVFLLGNRSDVEQFYGRAEFFVSASKMEGLSNAYLEALAFDLPLVATKTAGTDELIEDGVNGYYVANEGPEAIIVALNKAVNNANMASMREAAASTARRFDIHKTVAEYEALLVEIFSKKQ